MDSEFQRQQPYEIDEVDKSIKADYYFTFFPMVHPPVQRYTQVTIAIPDPGFVSLEDAIDSVLWEAATAKLDELEKALPGYLF